MDLVINLKEVGYYAGFSALIFTALVFIIITIIKFTRKSRWDSNIDRAQLEKFREYFEGELYKLNRRLMSNEDRWQDVNHLLISASKNTKTINRQKKVIMSQFLKNAGLTDQDLIVEPKTAMVLTPFHQKFYPEYEIINKICTDVGLRCYRGDEDRVAGDILHHILKLMVRSRLVIANIEGRNPNVFYELGIAHAIDKPTIIIAKYDNIEKLPVDLVGYRMILYEDYDELKEMLKNELGKIGFDY